MLTLNQNVTETDKSPRETSDSAHETIEGLLSLDKKIDIVCLERGFCNKKRTQTTSKRPPPNNSDT